MDLLEYQAKELFHQMGIPVLPSQRIDNPKDLKGLKIPYPVVLKSQVYAGGRAKAGGIKFVENTIDAVAAAHTIFSLPIMGQYPEVVLAEAKYDPSRELYLAVILDRSARCPLLLGSQEGGVEVEAIAQQIQRVIVDQEFSPFYARRLALQMGLQGELILSVSAIVEKMYRLFVQKDLDLVEINPLAIGSQGEVMALDGKVTVNNSALSRHPEMTSLQVKIPSRARARLTVAAIPSLNLVQLDGNIGILCNGAGLTMATLDLVYQSGGKPANFLNVGGVCWHHSPSTTLEQRIEYGLEMVTRSRGVKVVLVNILENVIPCTQIAAAIANYLKRRYHHITPALVVRLMGNQLAQAKESLAMLEVFLFDDLDAAIAQAVSLSKSKFT